MTKVQSPPCLENQFPVSGRPSPAVMCLGPNLARPWSVQSIPTCYSYRSPGKASLLATPRINAVFARPTWNCLSRKHADLPCEVSQLIVVIVVFVFRDPKEELLLRNKILPTQTPGLSTHLHDCRYSLSIAALPCVLDQTHVEQQSSLITKYCVRTTSWHQGSNKLPGGKCCSQHVLQIWHRTTAAGLQQRNTHNERSGKCSRCSYTNWYTRPDPCPHSIDPEQ